MPDVVDDLFTLGDGGPVYAFEPVVGSSLQLDANTLLPAILDVAFDETTNEVTWSTASTGVAADGAYVFFDRATSTPWSTWLLVAPPTGTAKRPSLPSDILPGPFASWSPRVGLFVSPETAGYCRFKQDADRQLYHHYFPTTSARYSGDEMVLD